MHPIALCSEDVGIFHICIVSLIYLIQLFLGPVYLVGFSDS